MQHSPISDLFGEAELDMKAAKLGRILFGLNGCWVNKLGTSFGSLTFGTSAFDVEDFCWLLRKQALEIPNNGEYSLELSIWESFSSDLT